MDYPDQTPTVTAMANDSKPESLSRAGIVVPEIIVTQPRIQWMPHSRKGGRILLDLDALQASQPPNSKLDFTNHPRYSSYYASPNPPRYGERCASLHSPHSHFPESQATMEQSQQRLPSGATPTGPRQQIRSHPIQRLTDMNLVDFDSPQVSTLSSRRTSRSRRSTAASKAITTRKENEASHLYETTAPAESQPLEENPKLSELADEALKFTDPAKYRRKMIEAQRVASGGFFPSVLEPKIKVTEISYDDAIAAITKETGPLLMNLKNIPPRPVDLVLYDPTGSSLAVFTLLLTKEVDLIWLISWIQVFVDKWVKNEHHPDILVVRSVKIRMAGKAETECYPPLQGAPIDRTQRDATGSFKGFFFMKWDCHDSQMEKYWEVFRCMLQMGAGDPQKPIFKVYTISFPLATAPVNLRDEKSLAPSQYFDNGTTDLPLLAEDFFLKCNDKIGYARMTSSSEAAFVARELQIADNLKLAQACIAPAIQPTASNASCKEGGNATKAVAKSISPHKAAHSNSIPRNMIISLPMEFEGSAKEKSYLKHPQDKWVTLAANGESIRVFAPYRKPVSEDPTRVWSYYQKWGGGNPAAQAAFNFDDIPFEVEQFPSYKIINGTAVNLNADGNVDREDVTVTEELPGKTNAAFGHRGAFGNSATLGSEPVKQDSSIYDPNTVVGQERLFRYQKEFEAAKGFDSGDDDIYFPKRGQPPSPPKDTFRPKERWFEKKKPSAELQTVQFVDQRKKELQVPQPQQLFPGFAATARPNDHLVTSTHQLITQKGIDSPFQTFPRWDNPQLIHDLPGTQVFRPATNMTSLTVMNPGAPSFQVHDQSDSPMRLNVNAPAFQQSTVSVPPHRIIPIGYGSMTPISGNSPAISPAPSQLSLKDHNFQNGLSVDSLTSDASHLHINSNTFNAINHNFDNFSKPSQGSSPPKKSIISSWSNTQSYGAQPPPIGSSFRSAAYGFSSNVSSCQHSQTQNQARNPHITSLNHRLQAQSQVRERPDRSRTFDRDKRQPAGNRGYGTDSSGMTGNQNFYLQGFGRGSQYQTMPALGAGRGNLKPDLTHSNSMASLCGAQQKSNTSSHLLSPAHFGNNTALGLEQQVQLDIPRARSFSPKKTTRHGLSARASGISDHAIQNKRFTKEQEEKALKGIVDNFQTSAVQIQPQSGDSKTEVIAEATIVPDLLVARPVTPISHRQIYVKSPSTSPTPKNLSPVLPAETLDPSSTFCPEPVVTTKSGAATSLDL